MRIPLVKEVLDTHKNKFIKISHHMKKPLMYTLLGLGTLSILNSCSGNNKENETQDTEMIPIYGYYDYYAQYPAAQIKAQRRCCNYYAQQQMIQRNIQNECNSNFIKNSGNSKTTSATTVTAKTNSGFNYAQQKAFKYIFKKLCAYDVQVTKTEDNEILIHEKGVVTPSSKWYYSVKSDKDEMVLTYNEHLFGACDYPIYHIKIRYNKDGSFMVTVIDKDKTLKFDRGGNIISPSEQNIANKTSIQDELDNVKFFDNTNKNMLAYVIASMNINSVDILEQGNYAEIFCENNDASYQFIVKKGKDNSVYGIANKMLADGNLQSETADGSSETYAFKCADKSTSNTQRMQVSSMRVVQNDIDNTSDVQSKFKERTSKEHTVSDYKVARGFLGGADIMATNEKTFTTKYLSEGAENRIYTLDEAGRLKINGRYAFSTEY